MRSSEINKGTKKKIYILNSHAHYFSLIESCLIFTFYWKIMWFFYCVSNAVVLINMYTIYKVFWALKVGSQHLYQTVFGPKKNPKDLLIKSKHPVCHFWLTNHSASEIIMSTRCSRRNCQQSFYNTLTEISLGQQETTHGVVSSFGRTEWGSADQKRPRWRR